jgi:hypothetical protein
MATAIGTALWEGFQNNPEENRGGVRAMLKKKFPFKA